MEEHIIENTPLVTIIITTYKGDWKLNRAIESCLRQTYNKIEVIVVDDNGNGTEGQKKTISLMNMFESNPKVTYIKHSVNRNGSAARNTGIEASHGEYLAFLDDDDIYRKDRIEKCVAVAEKSSRNNVGVYTGVVSIVGNNCVGRCVPKLTGNIQNAMLVNQGLLGSGSNLFIPKWVAEKVKGFDESFCRFQDVEFMVRAMSYLYMLPIEECMIIKDNTNVRFVPNYSGLKDATHLFLKKFQRQLNSIDEGKKAIFNTYVFLLLYAYKCNDKNAVAEAIKLISDLDVQNMSLIKLRLKGNLLKYSDTLIYRFYKKTSDRRKNKRIRTELNEEELAFIEGVIEKGEEKI